MSAETRAGRKVRRPVFTSGAEAGFTTERAIAMKCSSGLYNWAAPFGEDDLEHLVAQLCATFGADRVRALTGG
jgi:hypothetical protein